MLLVRGMRNATNDNDPLTFRPLAIAVANVVTWLEIRMTEDAERHDSEQHGDAKDQQNDKQRRVHASAHVIDDDDCNDRREKAERENDSDAGRQVVARRARLKPFACLSV